MTNIDANIETIRRKPAADARALKLAQDKSGWTAVREQWNATNDAEEAALLKLCRTKPTTLAGLAELAAYASGNHDDFLEGARHGEVQTLFETIAKSAAGIGRTV